MLTRQQNSQLVMFRVKQPRGWVRFVYKRQRYVSCDEVTLFWSIPIVASVTLSITCSVNLLGPLRLPLMTPSYVKTNNKWSEGQEVEIIVQISALFFPYMPFVEKYFLFDQLNNHSGPAEYQSDFVCYLLIIFKLL